MHHFLRELALPAYTSSRQQTVPWWKMIAHHDSMLPWILRQVQGAHVSARRVFEHFSWLWVFPFRRRLSSRPPALHESRRAADWHYVQDTWDFHRANLPIFDRHPGNSCRCNRIVSRRERGLVCSSGRVAEIIIRLTSSHHHLRGYIALAQCHSRAAFHPFISG